MFYLKYIFTCKINCISTQLPENESEPAKRKTKTDYKKCLNDNKATCDCTGESCKTINTNF